MDKTLESWVKCKFVVSMGKAKFTSQQWLHGDMPSEWNATQNKGIHVHAESALESSLTTKWQQKSNDVTRGNRNTLKLVCMLKPGGAQSVTSLMLKRELENVRR